MSGTWINAVADELRGIGWFANCGKASDFADVGVDVIRAAGWPDAIARCSAPEWEETTLNAQAALTTHLLAKYPHRYAQWNQVVRQAKAELVSTIVDPAIHATVEGNDLPQVFVDCVRWDIVGAAAEMAFADCHPPYFYRRLLLIYKKGHFPCGWDGEWPRGRLVVW